MTGQEILEKGIAENNQKLIDAGLELIKQDTLDKEILISAKVQEKEAEEDVDLAVVPQDEQPRSHRDEHDFSFQIINGDRPHENVDREDGGTYARREPIDQKRLKVNLFHDDGEVVNEKDKEFDAKITKNRKVKPKPAQKKMNANCVGCHKDFEVFRSALRLREGVKVYICDRCVVRRTGG
jgi:hypothetical protein